MPPRIPKTPTATELGLKAQIDSLEERNQELANALGDTLKDLYLQLATVKDLDSNAHDALKQTLNRAVSVQSCLQDPSLPLPILAPDSTPVEEDDETNEAERSPILPPKDPKPTESETHATASNQPNTVNGHVDSLQSNAKNDPPEPGSGAGETNAGGPPEARREAQRPNLRPSLSDAGFSWMLEGSRNLSSFVSSASVPPEQTRHQESPRTKGSPLFGSNGEEKPGSDSEHDELALRSLRGPL
jgi:TBC1 domain family protein 5